MNKSEFIDKMAAEGGSKAEAEKAYDLFIATINQGLRDEGKVQLTGFGTFQLKDRAERNARNPKTGETIKVAASRAVTFKPGKTLKDSFN